MGKVVQEREQLPADVAAAAAGLGAHRATWFPRYSWRPVLYLALPGAAATRAVTWLVESGAGAPAWLVASQVTGAGVFSAVFVVLLWSALDPRWRRVRVFGFDGGLVRCDKAGRLSTVTWGGIARAGRQPRRNGSPGPIYEIRPREGRAWYLTVNGFRCGHVQALAGFVERNLQGAPARARVAQRACVRTTPAPP